MEFQRIGKLAYRVAKKHNVLRMPWPNKRISTTEQQELVRNWEYFIEYPEYSHICLKNQLFEKIDPRNLDKYIK
jgi:hypothetical protein